MTQTHLASIPRLSASLTTSVMHTAVVLRYSSPDDDALVLVYRIATVYAAATSVITVRQYSLKATLLSAEGERDGGRERGRGAEITGFINITVVNQPTVTTLPA